MSVREGRDAGRNKRWGYMRTWVRLKNAARVRESPGGASWYLAHEARDKTVSRHGRCGLRAGRGWRQWVGTKRSVCGTYMAQRSLGGAYLAADVAAAHRVTRMLLDVLGLYKESCWLDALP